MPKDPNELGTIWINEGRGGGAGKLFFGGKVFEIPRGGITVDLLPFSFTDAQTGQERRGWRVISRTDAGSNKQQREPGDDSPDF